MTHCRRAGKCAFFGGKKKFSTIIDGNVMDLGYGK